jgi:hypothetical protein
MYVTELDRPAYLIIEKRGFDDKELGIDPRYIRAAREAQDRSNELQQWLREVYLAGDRSYRVGPPSWLVELADGKPEQRDIEVVLNKTLPKTSKQKASSSSTNQSS